MRVLLIGSGGRESALAYKLSGSKSLEQLYISPGNPGTEEYGKNVSIQDTHEAVLSFCTEKKIDLVVVGPEVPLVKGIGEFLRTNNILVFGPDSKAAQIESSKSFSKHLMNKYGVPTAAYKEFSSLETEEALLYLKSQSYPVVIKADGLAAGKGVIIALNYKEAEESVYSIFRDNLFGQSGSKIIIEEFMEGEEASIFAITDGKDFVTLPPSQDHKRIGDNDTGKNTGGMGAYAPAPLVNKEIMTTIEEKIIAPVLSAMNKEGYTFIGCLYAGVMLTKSGVKVVEFNCRFGDPETQAVMPLLEGEFAQLLYSAAAGNLDKSLIKYNGGSSVCVVAASEGYPDSYKSGFEIAGLNKTDGVFFFHAGTKSINNKIITSGGRVIGVTSFVKENDLRKAKDKAYSALSQICFDNIYFRKDIADKAFKYLTEENKV